MKGFTKICWTGLSLTLLAFCWAVTAQAEDEDMWILPGDTGFVNAGVAGTPVGPDLAPIQFE